FFLFSSSRRHTSFSRDWSSDVCSSDLQVKPLAAALQEGQAVAVDQLMSALVDAVEFEIACGPVQIGTGHVHAGRGPGAAQRGMRSEERRVGEEGRDREEAKLGTKIVGK